MKDDSAAAKNHRTSIVEEIMEDTHLASTKTTLSGLVAELHELVPDRFSETDLADYWKIALRGDSVVGYNADSCYAEAVVQSACQEECDARGWHYRLSSHPNGYSVSIREGDARIGESRIRHSPAIAFATALRNALHEINTPSA